MDLGLKGKTALVVAASKGMGKASAMGLASEGARVAMCSRGEADLGAAAEETPGPEIGHTDRRHGSGPRPDGQHHPDGREAVISFSRDSQGSAGRTCRDQKR